MKMKRDGSKLRCPDCGVETEPRCNCGKDYICVPAYEAIKLCREAHPDWNDPKIAKETGTNQSTVWRFRHSGYAKALPEESHEEDNNDPKFRKGKDNKMYPTRVPSRGKRLRPVLERAEEIIESTVEAGKPVTRNIGKMDGVGEHSIRQAEALREGREQGRLEVLAELGIDPPTLPQSAQVKIEAAIRHHKKRLDSEFELAVLKEISRRVDELVAPRFLEREKEAEECRQAYRRKGVFKKDEYNIIQRCLHPDLSPSIEEKTEAWRLLHSKRLVLLSEQDDPRTYPPIPTAEEFMAGVRRPKRT